MTLVILKCLGSEKQLMLISEAFQREQEWRFLFRNIFSCFRDIQVFVQKLMMSQILYKYKNKSQNQEYLRKYCSDAAQIWHQ